MNKHSDSVTAGDIIFLALCILGFLTGLAGIMMTTPWLAILGAACLFIGVAYFGVLQAVDA